MTKEEILEAIADDKTMPFIQPEQLAGIVDFVIENYKQELPANLDEAAEMYESGLQNPDYQDSGYTDNDMIDAFKAGAEWMEGQGVTCGGRIMKSSMGETYAESDYVPLDGKCGDKVIVQIRKK